MKKFVFVLPLLIFTNVIVSQTSKQVVIDSIIKLRELSMEASFSSDARIIYAQQAVKLSEELKVDSTKLRSNYNLSLVYLNYDKNILFGNINLSNLELAKRLQDTLYIGYTYQNLGYYYTTQTQNDSAYYYYYNAVKVYDKTGDIRNKGETLFTMANIQETERDYIGSEQNAIEAIKLISSLPETQSNLLSIHKILNLLSVISERLGDYISAIEYQEKAIDVCKKIEDNLYYLVSAKNNLAYYLFQQKKYKVALKIYEELDNEMFIEFDPELYVMVKGNIALTKAKLGEDSKEVEKIFKEAYKITDSLNDPYGLLAIGNDMADFYVSQKENELAKFYTSKTLKAAREINSTKEILRSLKLLSIVEEGNSGKEYLLEHIKLSDSLLKNERAIRNKFARIEFETDQLEAEKDQLAKERLLFIFISIGLLMSLTLLYVVISQRSKNRKLKFIQQQQETNEEIYNLMLAQQDKIEEGRTQEKKRISEELHDGVLGKLFGTRLSLDSLNMVQTDDAVKTRSQYIDELKNIETEIRKISHDLNTDFVSGSSFIDIVESLIETQTKAYQLEHTFKNDDSIDWEDIPNKTKIHIYRMLQETMQNIYKHANANSVKISFQLKNNVILCTIEDDGSGFNVNKARKGIGLKNIDSRVRDVGGKAEVFSKIDIGTIIKISIPIE